MRAQTTQLQSRALAQEYQDALQRYLDGGGEAALEQAYEIGRRGLAGSLGVLEMAAVQYEVLIDLLKKAHVTSACAGVVQAAKNFAVESLSTFEMTHRGFRERNYLLSLLNERLNGKIEEGAKQVAHVLHDEAGQLLAAVIMALDQATAKVPARNQQDFLEVREQLKQVEDQLRRLSHELRPMILDHLGIVPALHFLAEGVSERSGIPITLEGASDGRLAPVIETTLYRTVQEALNNMAKHARATKAKISVQREPKMIRCTVEDDGTGFDVEGVFSKRGDRGLGLIGMQERLASVGGVLQITSGPAGGTEVVITIPFHSMSPQRAVGLPLER